jgi:hypothetical protein
VLIALGVALHLAVATSLANETVARLRERAGIMQAVVERAPPAFPQGLPPNDLITQVPAGVGFVIGGSTYGTAAVVLRSDGSPIVGGSQAGALESVGLPDEAGYRAALAGETNIREVEVNDIPGRILSVPLTVHGETVIVQVFAATGSPRSRRSRRCVRSWPSAGSSSSASRSPLAGSTPVGRSCRSATPWPASGSSPRTPATSFERRSP